MNKLLTATLLLATGCTHADSGPTHAAIAAYLKKSLHDPASYEAANWGPIVSYQQKDADQLAAKDATEKADISMHYLRLENERVGRMIRLGATKAQLNPFEAHFNGLAAEVKHFQQLEASLFKSTNTTELGTSMTHAYRAKNKLGALQLDSAQFIVYKNGKVERL
jgi:hypothetical protein